jgi:6-phosphogluconolactonase (cycloisomerase 2 family)
LDSTSPGNFTLNQNLPYTLSKPGPDASRQDAPHEHEAILDPTGQYILVNDLGADLVRIYSFDKKTLALKALEPLKAAPGSGPRHAAFWNPSSVSCEDGCTTYFYLVAELASTVTGYELEYLPNGGGLKFTEVYKSSTYGPSLKQPSTNAPAEIHISTDNRFVVISNRINNSFNTSSGGASDSISTFALNKNGTLSFVQLSPSGGLIPRQYSMNAIGDLLAVGNQNSMNLVIFERDIVSGKIGETPVVEVKLPGNTTYVAWDEERALGVLGG